MLPVVQIALASVAGSVGAPPSLRYKVAAVAHFPARATVLAPVGIRGAARSARGCSAGGGFGGDPGGRRGRDGGFCGSGRGGSVAGGPSARVGQRGVAARNLGRCQRRATEVRRGLRCQTGAQPGAAQPYGVGCAPVEAGIRRSFWGAEALVARRKRPR
jgi:hypothetical protein